MNHKLVNFLICGAQKAGTTALNSYLRAHPKICMAKTKEVHFFDDDQRFETSNIDYLNYHAFFKPDNKEIILGESTPIYMYWNKVPERIYAYNPNMKLILILRDPSERAFSHWNMERLRNKEHRSFFSAIKQELVNHRRGIPTQNRVTSYIDRGYYFKQLSRLKQFFPVDNILVIRQESLISQKNETLNEIFTFLSIENDINITPIIEHRLPYKNRLHPKERHFLIDLFKTDILSLEQELNWNCKSWLSN